MLITFASFLHIYCMVAIKANALEHVYRQWAWISDYFPNSFFATNVTCEMSSSIDCAGMSICQTLPSLRIWPLVVSLAYWKSPVFFAVALFGSTSPSPVFACIECCNYNLWRRNPKREVGCVTAEGGGKSFGTKKTTAKSISSFNIFTLLSALCHRKNALEQQCKII